MKPIPISLETCRASPSAFAHDTASSLFPSLRSRSALRVGCPSYAAMTSSSMGEKIPAQEPLSVQDLPKLDSRAGGCAARCTPAAAGFVEARRFFASTRA